MPRNNRLSAISCIRDYRIQYVFLVIIIFQFFGCTVLKDSRSGFSGLKHNLVGGYYLENEKYDEGIAAFTDELKTHPDNGQLHYFLGRYLLAKDNPREARPHMEKAVESNPDKADYHFWLGIVYAGLKESNLERMSYVSALKREPDHVQALTYLSYNQIERREYREALETSDKILKLVADHPSALYNRAFTLRQLKRRPEERIAWKKYLSHYSSGLTASQAVNYLNEMGDFEYRSYLIGSRRMTLKTGFFEQSTADFSKDSYTQLDSIGRFMMNNKDISIHVVAYCNANRGLAEKRTKLIKSYLTSSDSFNIESHRLMVSWFAVPEQIRAGNRVFGESESINFITAVKSPEQQPIYRNGRKKT